MNEVSEYGGERGMDRWINQCVAWPSLYRVKYVTRLELVEGKFSK